MAMSMIAGGGAALLTNPLDIVKLRLQVQRASSSTATSEHLFHYDHMLDGLKKIIIKEGPLALFNGSFARIWTHIPNVAISMSVLEYLKPFAEKIINS